MFVRGLHGVRTRRVRTGSPVAVPQWNARGTLARPRAAVPPPPSPSSSPLTKTGRDEGHGPARTCATTHRSSLSPSPSSANGTQCPCRRTARSRRERATAPRWHQLPATFHRAPFHPPLMRAPPGRIKKGPAETHAFHRGTRSPGPTTRSASGRADRRRPLAARRLRKGPAHHARPITEASCPRTPAPLSPPSPSVTVRPLMPATRARRPRRQAAARRAGRRDGPARGR